MNTLSRIFTLSLAICLPGLCAIAEVPHVEIGRFPQEVAVKYTVKDGLPSNNALSIHLDAKSKVYAETDRGWAVLQNGEWAVIEAPERATLLDYIPAESYRNMDINQITEGPDGQLVTATAAGLLESTPNGFEAMTVEDGLGRRWGASDVRGVCFDSKGQLWFGTLAGAACKTHEGWAFYTGAEGLPYNDFTILEAGPDGVVWFGTHIGAVRFDGNEWAYRQGGWLPNDDIRDIAVDDKGNAWFATAGGVGLIERRMMTLAEKADFYEEEMEKYIRRTSYGYVSRVGLGAPGDKGEIHYSDSDNDGLWTAMYGAGECFAYAATKDPRAKERAKRAFEALRFLQKVTQNCKFSPPKGYVARTVLPGDGKNPNDGRIERDRKKRETEDTMWKVYEPRWPKSADGKWFWKSDTSSDELDGHYFFYPLYYDLVADTEDEKERVREVVRDLTDHLVKHGYRLIEHEGTVTRWGDYSPESMNNHRYWWTERGLKSLSMLAYLAIAEHVTGDPVYGDHMQELMDKEYYHTNAMHDKIQRGIGSGNHSDDEMAFMSYYNLLNYMEDSDVKTQLLYSFYSAWAIEEPEMNPFFNFAYAAHGLNKSFTSPYGTANIEPWEGWLEDSMATLKGFPLDRCNWRYLNSHRTDIQPLPRQQAVGLTERMRGGRGYRVNGKVVPVENRHFNHWNTDPWELDSGGNGQQLASGTVFLLPYYMGLYHGFILETE